MARAHTTCWPVSPHARARTWVRCSVSTIWCLRCRATSGAPTTAPQAFSVKSCWLIRLPPPLPTPRAAERTTTGRARGRLRREERKRLSGPCERYRASSRGLFKESLPLVSTRDTRRQQAERAHILEQHTHVPARRSWKTGGDVGSALSRHPCLSLSRAQGHADAATLPAVAYQTALAPLGPATTPHAAARRSAQRTSCPRACGSSGASASLALRERRSAAAPRRDAQRARPGSDHQRAVSSRPGAPFVRAAGAAQPRRYATL